MTSMFGFPGVNFPLKIFISISVSMLARTFIASIIASMAAAPRSFRSACTSALCLAFAAQSAHEVDALSRADFERWGATAKNKLYSAGHTVQKGAESLATGAVHTYNGFIEDDRVKFATYVAKKRAQALLDGVTELANDISEQYEEAFEAWKQEILDEQTVNESSAVDVVVTDAADVSMPVVTKAD